MKKFITLILAVSFMLSFISGCTLENINNFNDFAEERQNQTQAARSGSRGISRAPLEIVPFDYIPAAKIGVQPKKAYTVLVYMNGSDLESEYMSATKDLWEMADSRFDEENINLLIFTGGARKWHTRGIPNRDNAIFRMTGGRLEMLAQIGRDPMGYPETLSGFINFGYNLFPADQYGIIFWNHGGGAITGYGHDERFNDPGKAMMKLSEIDSALAGNDLFKNGGRFDWIGFDTCLMATIEMACIAAKYGDYLIASEELEPEDGWDYAFLGHIYPGITGAETGVLISEYYINFYKNADIEDILTISVTDLSKIEAVANSFERLAIAGRNEIINGNFKLISRARSTHRSFGSRGEFADETDMIDAANLAKSLSRLIPREANALINAIDAAVIYKYETNIEELGGLSVYFPFANKDDLTYYMEIYRAIDQLPEYAGFIDSFAAILDSEPLVSFRGISDRGALTPEQLDNLAAVRQTTWRKSPETGRYIQIAETRGVNVNGDGTFEMSFPDECTTLNGRLVCLYETAPLKDGTRYAIPVRLNGRDADLIAVYCADNPDGKIIGAVPSGHDIYDILDKKAVGLRQGDKIRILYYSKPFGQSNESMTDGKDELWQKGEEFTLRKDRDGDLILRKEPLSEGEYIYGLNFVDLQQNKYYSNFLSEKID
jgi:hypothetical protein